MGNAASKKMFVCLLKTRADDRAYDEAHANAQRDHTRYMSELWRRGVFWAGGPLSGGKIALEIYSVDSLEQAMEAQRNAPHYKSGFLYEDEYFEWTPRHWPPALPNIDPSSGKLLDR
jgi:uncharacterized protein YciI